MVTTSFDGGAVVVTLGVMRFVSEDAAAQASDERTVPPVHVTARLAISPSGAVELASALNTMLKTLSERQQQSDGAQAGCKALWQREIQSVIVRRGPLAAAGREAAPVIT